jgi:hypothetical protein
MALHDDFEPVRGQLLHHTSLPTLDKAFCDLVREETRFHTLHSQYTQPTHPVLAAHFFGASSSPPEGSDKSSRGPPKNHDNNYCRYCRCRGQTIDKCWRKAKSNASAVAVTTTTSAPSLAIIFGESPGSPFTLSLVHFEAIVNQVLSRSSNASSFVLSVLPGKSSSWLFDSAYYNHMTPYASSFTTSSPSPHNFLIHTADGSTMTIQTIGIVHTPSLSVPNVFHNPKLSFNLLFVGQLCELGYRLGFYSFGVYVQDPQMGQTLGIGHMFGRLFELSSLHLSTSRVSVAGSLLPPSIDLCHSRLGHASMS